MTDTIFINLKLSYKGIKKSLEILAEEKSTGKISQEDCLKQFLHKLEKTNIENVETFLLFADAFKELGFNDE